MRIKQYDLDTKQWSEVEVPDEPIHEIEEVVPKPSIEEQILALQNALITQKISGGGYNNYSR